MTSDLILRRAEERDLVAINDIYNHYIKKTSITFDLTPWDMDQRRAWFAQFSADPRHILLVAEANATVKGYAGTMEFRKKKAYQTSVEATIYVAPGAEGQGIGSRLYQELLPLAAAAGAHRALAGITLPNDNSLKMHEKFGFRLVGNFSEVGFKFDRYWDVGWYELAL